MDRRTALATISGLLLVVVGLGVALALALADDDAGPPHMMSGGQSGYMGMMAAIGSADSDAMLERMREVLGDEAYQQMLGHFEDHQAGQGPSIDGMMHRMMDGMMGQMNADGMDLFPLPSATSPADADDTPTPSAAP